MRRSLVVLLAAGLVASGCGGARQDDVELRRFVNASERDSRTFVYREVGPDRRYEIEAVVEDDFRSRMVLSIAGRPVLERILSDDAMAVRVLDPTFVLAVGEELGHPDVVRAFRDGRWVHDPAGAPSLIDLAAAIEEEDRDRQPIPFDMAHRVFDAVRQGISEGFTVRQFSEEEIDYKPSQDPWRYPVEERGEVRYDIIRPWIPKSQDQLLGNQRGVDAVTEANFRKVSVFVNRNRVTEICGVVDVRGHEDFVEAREKGTNEFLLDLMRGVLAGETLRPIRPRKFHVTFDYADEHVAVALPEDAHVGNLEAFRGVLDTYLGGGVVAAAATDAGALSDCDRREE